MRKPNQLRIIGGKCRGRLVRFPDVPGLRPTPDRVRETLFNWLQGKVEGNLALDLFAGSGALGLEALSRGARQVVFVDSASRVAQQLNESLQQLDMQNCATVCQADSLKWLKKEPIARFDLIFLDPPFSARLLAEASGLLENGGWLAEDALVYLEQDSSHDWPVLPANWQLHRESKAGQSSCRLFRRATMPAVDAQADFDQ